jgi:hypothetical protein
MKLISLVDKIEKLVADCSESALDTATKALLIAVQISLH